MRTTERAAIGIAIFATNFFVFAQHPPRFASFARARSKNNGRGAGGGSSGGREAVSTTCVAG